MAWQIPDPWVGFETEKREIDRGQIERENWRESLREREGWKDEAEESRPESISERYSIVAIYPVKAFRG